MLQRDITDNTLFYGDNLAILRAYIPDEALGTRLAGLLSLTLLVDAPQGGDG